MVLQHCESLCKFICRIDCICMAFHRCVASDDNANCIPVNGDSTCHNKYVNSCTAFHHCEY